MRIAALMEGFPSISETYILWHLCHLAQSGVDLTLLPATLNDTNKVHEDVIRFGLMEKVRAPAKAARGRVFVRAQLLAELLRAGTRDLKLIPHLVALAAKRESSMVGWPQIVRHVAHIENLGKFDVAHAYFGPSGRRAQMLRDVGQLQAPLVVSFLGFDLNVLPGRTPADYYTHLFERADRLCVSSRFMRDRLVQLGAGGRRIDLLPLGLPLDGFRFQARSLSAGQTMRIVIAARLVEVKGIEFGLKGLAQAIKQGLDAHWDIYGDGPRRQALESLTESLGLHDAVTFHGFVPIQDVQVALDQAHICLYPGVKGRDGAEEALGGTVLEAQAAGMPVVATNVGGIPDAFVAGESGILVDPESPDAICRGLLEMRERAAEWPSMGRAGRTHVEENYDCFALNERWLQLYREL